MGPSRPVVSDCNKRLSSMYLQFEKARKAKRQMSLWRTYRLDQRVLYDRRNHVCRDRL